MMSAEFIRSESERHARKAKRNGAVPCFLTGLGDDAIRDARIPFLGDYVPRGFVRVNVGETFGAHHGAGTLGHAYLLVDSSGWGSPGELAMTFHQFGEFAQRNPSHGYAIAEAGQFQVVLAVYKRTQKEKVHVLKVSEISARLRATAEAA